MKHVRNAEAGRREVLVPETRPTRPSSPSGALPRPCVENNGAEFLMREIERLRRRVVLIRGRLEDGGSLAAALDSPFPLQVPFGGVIQDFAPHGADASECGNASDG